MCQNIFVCVYIESKPASSVHRAVLLHGSQPGTALRLREHSPNHLAFQLFLFHESPFPLQFNAGLNYSCQSPSIQQPSEPSTQEISASRRAVCYQAADWTLRHLRTALELRGWRSPSVMLVELIRFAFVLMDVLRISRLEMHNNVFNYKKYWYHSTYSVMRSW